MISASLLIVLVVSHKRIFNNYLRAVSTGAFRESISMVSAGPYHLILVWRSE